ncbi:MULTISPECIES: hypothetical protein [unclassified Streptomyces]|uniref:hypothetical protein n=1 Tax=unclassified Streptomyces TaxID=2593676 RepID=UPI001EF0C571|nr:MULTISPECIES: hypothetical protein [unclassified Streptomyces]
MSDSCPRPCCGHRVLDALPGAYEICPVRLREEGRGPVPPADQGRRDEQGLLRGPGSREPLLVAWEHLVEESRTWSLLEASEAPVGDDVFVAPTWVDRTDLHPER